MQSIFGNQDHLCFIPLLIIYCFMYWALLFSFYCLIYIVYMSLISFFFIYVYHFFSFPFLSILFYSILFYSNLFYLLHYFFFSLVLLTKTLSEIFYFDVYRKSAKLITKFRRYFLNVFLIYVFSRLVTPAGTSHRSRQPWRTSCGPPSRTSSAS